MSTKKDYIAHVVSFGVPKFVAKRMAKEIEKNDHLSFDDAIETSVNGTGSLLSFAFWDDTEEGFDFWNEMHKMFIRTLTPR